MLKLFMTSLSAFLWMSLKALREEGKKMPSAGFIGDKGIE